MTRIIAHRGMLRSAQENTLEAVAAAAEHGIDGVELDLTVTRDGEVVCFHDEPAARRRLLGDPDWKISAHRLDEVDERPLSATPAYTGATLDFGRTARIPRLDDVLAAFGDQLSWVLDVRTLGSGVPLPLRARLVERTVATVTRHGLLDRTIFASFDVAALHLVRARSAGRATTAFQFDDSVPVVGRYLGQNATRMLADDAQPVGRAARLLDHLKASRLTRWALGGHGATSIELTGLDEVLVRRLKGQGLRVGTYTLFPLDLQGTEHAFDETLQARILERLAAAGLDWVETDDPLRARAVLDGRR